MGVEDVDREERARIPIELKSALLEDPYASFKRACSMSLAHGIKLAPIPPKLARQIHTET
jgi:hypothetical protein